MALFQNRMLRASDKHLAEQFKQSSLKNIFKLQFKDHIDPKIISTCAINHNHITISRNSTRSLFYGRPQGDGQG